MALLVIPSATLVIPSVVEGCAGERVPHFDYAQCDTLLLNRIYSEMRYYIAKEEEVRRIVC